VARGRKAKHTGGVELCRLATASLHIERLAVIRIWSMGSKGTMRIDINIDGEN
jgi:hypothetical protein